MTSTDVSFPRGGYASTTNVEPGGKRRKQIKNLFGNDAPAKKSKTRRKRQYVEEDVEATSLPDFINKTEAMTAVSADTLTYNKIYEGMSLLACVKRVNTINIDIELPGRCFGEIQIQNISAQYTQLLSDAVATDEWEPPTTEAILQPGNFLPVRVLKVDYAADKRVYCSCTPADVNQHYKHADFKRQMLVWGAIKEKSDHGYVVDVGVKNCRAHLPFAAVDDGTEYPLGAVLYLTVAKSVGGSEATTLTLSALRASFDKTTESVGTSLDKVVPGMRVAFLVQKHLGDGLQGQYFGECVGFVNDLYLRQPFDNAKQYKPYDSVQARLLYVHPASKLGYFTLKPLDHAWPAKMLTRGAWVAATVVSTAGGGLLVRLAGGLKGFVTHRRLLKVAKIADEEDLATAIANKFPIGSTRHCTVLDYNHVERLYICTFERIAEVIDVGQLAVGQVVAGTVAKINDHGLVVKVGMVEAFAPKDHLSNVRYSPVIRSQFKVGQAVSAKVWSINVSNRSVVLTLKPDLVSSDVHLSSYEDYSPTEQYPGVVGATTPKGALIVFYDGVKGWLSARDVPQLGSKDARDEFYCGQVVKVRVAQCVNGKLVLTMNLLGEKKKKKVEESDEGIASADDKSGDDENGQALDEQIEVEKVGEVSKKKKKKKEKKRKLEADQSSETEIKKSKRQDQENNAELVEEIATVSKKKKKMKLGTDDSSEGKENYTEKIKSSKNKQKKRTIETDESPETKVNKSNSDVDERVEEVETSKKKKKKKQRTMETETEMTQSMDQEEQVVVLPKKKKKKLQKEVVEHVAEDKPVAVLSGMSSFFDEDVPVAPKDASDDEEQAPQQKRKLTPAERLQRAKDEEARLRKVEAELADDAALPQSAEQFDRALLGNPDDSELWTRYVAFHAQSTEFDKARAVARRAVERISHTAMQDRLNVWLAYLNLENLYGTKESFDATFAEAARSNDAMTVYLETIRMLADASKFAEMEAKVRKAKSAFKREAQMWLELGKIYYRCGKFAEARKARDGALLTLTDKKSHMHIMVQYAIMEFVHGEAAQGEALFETILQADPKRVDIWSSYVDQLVKREKIDLARNVLTRAVRQKLPYKKMRTLFKKYHAFELAHGDEEQLARVEQLLREYGDQ